VTVVKIERVIPPPQLLECEDEPDAPARPAPDQPRQQRDIAIYLNDLRAAGDDCRTKIRELHRYYDELPPAPPPKETGWWKEIEGFVGLPNPPDRLR